MGRSKYQGGSGETKDDAVIITEKSMHPGVAAEYEYVDMHCGERGVAWDLVKQSLFSKPDGRHYDLIKVRLADGRVRDFYFDITAFFGKF